MNKDFIDLFSIKGRKALVLGASRGIGLAISKLLASMGGCILGVARQKTDLLTMRNSLLENDHAILATDLSTTNGINKLIAKIEKWGNPDIVVANVYFRKASSKIINLSPDPSQNIFKSLGYLLRLIPFCLPGQREKKFGRWIGISSMAAKINSPGQMLYSLEKNAIESIFRTIAVEEGKYGITANTVSPGIINTEGVNNNYPSELLKTFAKMNCIGRMGNPEEVASLVAFLASPSASYITGINIPVCGGYNLGWSIPYAIEGKIIL